MSPQWQSEVEQPWQCLTSFKIKPASLYNAKMPAWLSWAVSSTSSYLCKFCLLASMSLLELDTTPWVLFKPTILEETAQESSVYLTNPYGLATFKKKLMKEKNPWKVSKLSYFALVILVHFPHFVITGYQNGKCRTHCITEFADGSADCLFSSCISRKPLTDLLLRLISQFLRKHCLWYDMNVKKKKKAKMFPSV